MLFLDMMWRFKDITFNTTNGLSSRLSNFGMYDLSTAVKIGGLLFSCFLSTKCYFFGENFRR